MGDFSENYSFIIHDAVQGHHWNNDQATIHPFVVYYANQGVLQSLNFVVISNYLVHDSVAVHLFVRKLLEFLTAKIVVQKVYYFSDGAASQYNNRKNFVNLAFHMENFKLPAEWHLSISSYKESTKASSSISHKPFASKSIVHIPIQVILLMFHLFL